MQFRLRHSQLSGGPPRSEEGSGVPPDASRSSLALPASPSRSFFLPPWLLTGSRVCQGPATSGPLHLLFPFSGMIFR